MLLYETLSHPLIFLIIFSIGLSSGLVFDLRNYINFLFLNKKFISIILDILACLIICFILFISNLKFNYGEFRFFILLAFFSGFLIQRLTLGIFVGKFFSWCYTKFRKIIDKFYERRTNKKKISTKS